MDWFIYDRDLRHGIVKQICLTHFQANVSFLRRRFLTFSGGAEMKHGPKINYIKFILEKPKKYLSYYTWCNRTYLLKTCSSNFCFRLQISLCQHDSWTIGNDNIFVTWYTLSSRSVSSKWKYGYYYKCDNFQICW